jgi:hypothetical protein
MVCLSEAYRNEFERLRLLDEWTNLEFKTRKYRPTPYRTPMATLPEP